MRLLSWNILQGGGKRAIDIADSIAELKPDIVTLQEFRNAKGAAPILDMFKSIGLTHIHRSTAEARKNTVMLASKYPINIAPWNNSVDLDLALHAQIEVAFGEHNQLDLFATHTPQKKKQIPYLDALYQLNLADYNNAIIIGDLNCGIPFEDSDTKSFDNTHLFQALLKKGWIDSWRSRNTSAREYTWVSSRDNGYRYDHCLSNVSANNGIKRIHYQHELRTSGLSDHSAIVVDFE